MLNEINNIKDATESAHAQIINMDNLSRQQINAYFCAFVANIEKELQAMEKVNYFIIIDNETKTKASGQGIEPSKLIGLLELQKVFFINKSLNIIKDEARH